jgi:phospholipase/carboxylesterase
MPESPRQMDEREYVLRKAVETTLAFLAEMELAQQQIGPESFASIRERFDREHAEALEARRRDLDRVGPLPGAEDLHTALREILGLLADSCETFCGSPGRPNPVLVLRSFHGAWEALHRLYPIRKRLPGVAHFFLEPEVVPRRAALDPDPTAGPAAAPVGIIYEKPAPERGPRTIYVPESYLDTRPWPLIVALHGGSRDGRDFIWAWLREAKSRGYLLLSPSSLGRTWAPQDEEGVIGAVADLAQRYNVDRARVLLTGLSDGATFTFIFGLAHPDVFTALAPLCGVLHPGLLATGHLEMGRALPIYLVHGAKDWMFPVETARKAARILEEKGFDHVYRELPEHSHAYPRSENQRILDWFEKKCGRR